ncbi:MAG: sensor histidine kinase [Lachnospiraceae bacterium]|nr:sensor histidine kinase [Lachnospiraceae bacterium]
MNDLKNKNNFTKGTVGSLLLIVFFVGIIILYYSMLYSETRSRMIVEGEVRAVSSAEQIDRYLTKGIDTISLVAYTLDDMINDNVPEATIHDYMVKQGSAVQNMVPECKDGLYGYINGKYIDSYDWEWTPDDDFNPIDRPWYIEAKANFGRVVVVNPYIDAKTGQTIITLVKTLGDAKSVIAMDVHMEHVQSIIDDLSRQNGADLIMILSGDYSVVAHTDKSEIGNNYLKEDGSLGSAVIDAYRSVDTASFSVYHNEVEYIVYTKALENGWLCASVIDTTPVYAKLRIPLILTTMVTIIFVAGVLIILMVANKRSVEAEKLEKSTEMALAANRAKTGFLTNMSNELKSPIHTILETNGRIIHRNEETDMDACSDNIKNAGNALVCISNDIMDYALLESGRLEINEVEYELRPLLEDMEDFVRNMTEKKGISLKTGFDRSLPCVLEGDVARLRQIITNLLTNAVKYTESGGVTFSVVRIPASGDPDDVVLQVSVIDTGGGIGPEDIKKLTEGFEYYENNSDQYKSHAGFELLITRALLEKMGAALRIESEPGNGTHMSFSLRQHMVNTEPIGDMRDRTK